MPETDDLDYFNGAHKDIQVKKKFNSQINSARSDFFRVSNQINNYNFSRYQIAST